MKAQQFLNVSSNATIADELGAIRAEIKALQDQQKFLETLLKSSHATEADGDLFHVSISYDIETTRVDWKDVAEKLNT